MRYAPIAAHRGRRRHYPLLGALWQLEPERYGRAAEAAADRLADRPTLDGPRVLLAAAPIDSTALHAAIEADGAVVVAELSPFGSGGVGADVEAAGDPFAALAEHYRRERSTRAFQSGAPMGKLEHVLGGVAAVVIRYRPTTRASAGTTRVWASSSRGAESRTWCSRRSRFGPTAHHAAIETLLRAIPEHREAHCG